MTALMGTMKATITDIMTGLKTMGMRIALGEAQALSRRNVLHLPSQVPMSSFSVWIQTLQRPMSVDSHVIDYFVTKTEVSS